MAKHRGERSRSDGYDPTKGWGKPHDPKDVWPSLPEGADPAGPAFEDMTPEQRRAAAARGREFDRYAAEHGHTTEESDDEDPPKGGFFSRLFGG